MATSKNNRPDLGEIMEDAEQELSSLEEMLLRIRHGVTAREKPLRKKTSDKKLLAQLLELEQSIIKRAKNREKK